MTNPKQFWVAAAGIGRGAHWYYAAAICLVIVAAALRFYELGQPLAYYDEVVAALNSGGTLAEVIQNTRTDNSSPLLYPLILYGIQQIDVSPFSIRFVPALSGVLAVAVILLLPRFGVRREAALLAALLATLAPEAIYEARGAREYGVDALAAALLIAGLLWYRNDGRKALLCGALLAAPLLQYGLVLFGAAVIGAGLLLPPGQDCRVKRGRSRREWMQDWLRRRMGMVWPAAFFLAGCVISYITALRYQLETAGPGLARDGYYANLYFRDEYRIVPVLEFAIARVGDVINHHLPPAAAITVVCAVTICLLTAAARRLGSGGANSPQRRCRDGGHWQVVATLFTLALAIAVGAALLGQYPARQTRHITYLGPAVFVFGGVALATAIQWTAAVIPGLTQRTPFTAAALRKRHALSLTLAIVAAAMILVASAGAIWHNNPYQTMKADDFFSALEQSVRADDIVYISPSARFIMTLYDAYYGREGYEQRWPDNYIQSERNCWHNYTVCIREVSNIVMESATEVSDVYVIYPVSFYKELKRYDERGSLESFGGSRHNASNPVPLLSLTLLRFPADGGLLDSVRQEWLGEYRPLLASDPAVLGFFDVYHNDGRLTYDREPCTPADAAAQFFLHIVPAGPTSVLPERSRPYGFDNRDFDFWGRGGALLENRCLVTVELPDYDIAGIRTGQYTDAGRIWETEFAPP